MALLSKKDLAIKLAVSEKTIDRLIKARKIPHILIKKSLIRFDEEKINNWIKMREVRMRHT
jgi:excisionase family DNA binding protein